MLDVFTQEDTGVLQVFQHHRGSRAMQGIRFAKGVHFLFTSGSWDGSGTSSLYYSREPWAGSPVGEPSSSPKSLN